MDQPIFDRGDQVDIPQWLIHRVNVSRAALEKEVSCRIGNGVCKFLRLGFSSVHRSKNFTDQAGMPQITCRVSISTARNSNKRDARSCRVRERHCRKRARRWIPERCCEVTCPQAGEIIFGRLSGVPSEEGTVNSSSRSSAP